MKKLQDSLSKLEHLMYVQHYSGKVDKNWRKAIMLIYIE